MIATSGVANACTQAEIIAFQTMGWPGAFFGAVCVIAAAWVLVTIAKN